MEDLKLEIEEMEYDEEVASRTNTFLEELDPLDGIGEDVEVDESEVEW